MASQYITFMIIFILGLNVVIITNGMFMTLSEQFQENIAEVEMSQILDLIKMQIQQALLLPTDFNQTYEQQLELPTALGQRFRYSITISNSTDNQMILHGFSPDKKINQIITFTVASKFIIETSESSFHSTNSLLTLNIEKNANNVVITIL